MDVRQLVGADLSNWQVVVWYQLSLPTGEVGSRVEGYFTDKDLATAQSKGAGWYGSNGTVTEVYVLTSDDKNGFVLDSRNFASLSDETTLLAAAIDRARAKLTPEELVLLRRADQEE